MLNRILTKIAKYFIISGITLSLVLTACFIYQEITNRNEYSYISLWTVKTQEKIFIKDKTKIHLVGMIHIASKDYYKKIISNSPLPTVPTNGLTKPNSIVTLLEGITDKDDLKKDQTPLDYESLSKLLGLVSQSKYYFQFPNIELADIDYSEIPLTLRADIGMLGKMIGQLSLFANKKITAEELEAFFTAHEVQIEQFANSMNENAEFDKIILEKRNDFLWTKIKASEANYQTILVPWGAKHLPDIELRLLSQGYILEKTITYNAVNILSVLNSASPWIVSLIYSFYLK